MPFWIKDPAILFNQKYISQIWPYDSLSYDEKLNASTRIVILITLLGYILINHIMIIVLGLIVVGSIVIMYMYTKKEGMFDPYYKVNDQPIDENNPFGNVLMSDYKYNPNKQDSNPPNSYSPSVEQKINSKVMDFVIQENHDNSDIHKLFNDTGDHFTFEQNLRQFNSNPSTTIPNNQDNFLKFCYGTLPSEKPLIIY